MAEVIKITRDGVTLGGAIRKNGDVLSPFEVPDGVRALIKSGAVIGAEWAEGPEVQAQSPVRLTPITMTHNPRGEPMQIKIPGPWEAPRAVDDDAPVQAAQASAPGVTTTTIPSSGTTSTVAVSTPASPVADVLNGTVDEVTIAVGMMSRADLDTVRQLEASGKNRKGVLDAVDARLSTLGA